MVLNIDLTSCQDHSNDTCFKTIPAFASHLFDSETQRFLEPMALRVMSAEESRKSSFIVPSTTFTVFIVFAIIVISIIALMKVLTNYNKHLHAKAGDQQDYGKLVGLPTVRNQPPKAGDLIKTAVWWPPLVDCKLTFVSSLYFS